MFHEFQAVENFFIFEMWRQNINVLFIIKYRGQKRLLRISEIFTICEKIAVVEISTNFSRWESIMQNFAISQETCGDLPIRFNTCHYSGIQWFNVYWVLLKNIAKFFLFDVTVILMYYSLILYVCSSLLQVYLIYVIHLNKVTPQNITLHNNYVSWFRPMWCKWKSNVIKPWHEICTWWVTRTHYSACRIDLN